MLSRFFAMILSLALSLLSLVSLFSGGLSVSSKTIGRDYTIWCVGNCDHDVTPASTTPGAVLMGGGVRISLSLSLSGFLLF